MKLDLQPLYDFLPCRTPEAWIQAALANQDLLLIDHAHCEKKAASTALNLLYRYPAKLNLLHKMSRLAREELLHFEQVLAIMQSRNIEYTHLSPSRYAAGLRLHERTHEPARLVDVLIIGAFIEARSCERFSSLIPHLDDGLANFYRRLLSSEARHFQDYLALAKEYSSEPIDARIQVFYEEESRLVLSGDDTFRFHSGIIAA